LLPYNKKLKPLARQLRKNMTESEKLLWSYLRRKQILGVQFYRQKPIDNYIVDFYAPVVRLVVEVDGSQHLQDNALADDAERTSCLTAFGLRVIRFDNREVLLKTEDVLQVIYDAVESGL
jgi:very-short-patch-repair endonuclease